MNSSIASRQTTKTSKSELTSEINVEEHGNHNVRKLLLCCGIASALLYVAMTIVVAMVYKGYSSFSQTVSELSAIGAPTRSLWVPMGFVFTLLITAFGRGVWLAADRNRPLRVAGGLLIAYGLVGLFWPPMHLRETLAAGGKTMTDTMHIAFTIVTGILMMLAMGFAALALGKGFRQYSIATVLVILVFGAVTGMDAPKLEANLPTPWMGVWERVNIYATMLWVIVLATLLLGRERSEPY